MAIYNNTDLQKQAPDGFRLWVITCPPLVLEKSRRKWYWYWGQHYEWAGKQVRHPDVFYSPNPGFCFVKTKGIFPPTITEKQLPTSVAIMRAKGKVKIENLIHIRSSQKLYTSSSTTLSIWVTKTLWACPSVPFLAMEPSTKLWPLPNLKISPRRAVSRPSVSIRYSPGKQTTAYTRIQRLKN